MKHKIITVFGTRPDAIKMAPVVKELARRSDVCDLRVAVTGQHREMLDQVLRAFDIVPDHDLKIMAPGQTLAEITSRAMTGLDAYFAVEKPDAVIAQGDTTTTLAAALAAFYHRASFGHVEAGLRSFDRRMPEETNRLVTDVLSDYLFASEPSGVANLLAEGIPKEKIFLVGNVMIDTLMKFREQAAHNGILDRLGLNGKDYAVATLHRPSNVDGMEHLASLLSMLSELARRLPVVFPVHPRTRERMRGAGLSERGLILTEPLGYLEFLRLTSEARLVLTDSGGIQEETTILHVPCLTMRENTERPITIEEGTNRLVGTDPKEILQAALDTLDAPPRFLAPPKFWDGKASARILDVLERSIGGRVNCTRMVSP